MLRWRLSLGTLIIAALVAVCWLDHQAAMPGVWLLPVAVVATVLASGEVLYLANAGGLQPAPWAVYLGNLLLLAANWAPPVCAGGAQNAAIVTPAGWLLVALAIGVLLVFCSEMARYGKGAEGDSPIFVGRKSGQSPARKSGQSPAGKSGQSPARKLGQSPAGQSPANLAVAVFALVYVGVMFGFVVQLRMQWNIGALASLVIVVKMGDTGAYAVGRLTGRHKLAPVLSPSKTIEGAFGQLVFACVASWATFAWLVPLTTAGNPEPGPWWRSVLFGLLVGTAGMFGDLAESLLKRTAGCKDSSRWMPGFGGVLDLLDSILLAAPIAWLCWACGLVPGG